MEAGSKVVAGATRGSRAGPLGTVVGAAVGAAESDAEFRLNVTYKSIGPNGEVYIGRTSCYCTSADQAIARRWSSHATLKARDFSFPVRDQALRGRWRGLEWGAIRGREQQLIDSFGGIGSPHVANQIRGVARINPSGWAYHKLSNAYFGEIAPYSGLF